MPKPGTSSKASARAKFKRKKHSAIERESIALKKVVKKVARKSKFDDIRTEAQRVFTDKEKTLNSMILNDGLDGYAHRDLKIINNQKLDCADKMDDSTAHDFLNLLNFETNDNIDIEKEDLVVSDDDENFTEMNISIGDIPRQSLSSFKASFFPDDIDIIKTNNVEIIDTTVNNNGISGHISIKKWNQGSLNILKTRDLLSSGKNVSDLSLNCHSFNESLSQNLNVHVKLNNLLHGHKYPHANTFRYSFMEHVVNHLFNCRDIVEENMINSQLNSEMKITENANHSQVVQDVVEIDKDGNRRFGNKNIIENKINDKNNISLKTRVPMASPTRRNTVVIICPFRISVVSYIYQIISILKKKSPKINILNKMRFYEEFGRFTQLKKECNSPNFLHFENFGKVSGDDQFTIGVKLTAHSIKLFTRFEDSDIIFTSPPGFEEFEQNRVKKNRQISRGEIEGKLEHLSTYEYIKYCQILIIDDYESINHLQNLKLFKDFISSSQTIESNEHVLSTIAISELRKDVVEGLTNLVKQVIVLSPSNFGLSNAEWIFQDFENFRGFADFSVQYRKEDILSSLRKYGMIWPNSKLCLDGKLGDIQSLKKFENMAYINETPISLYKLSSNSPVFSSENPNHLFKELLEKYHLSFLFYSNRVEYLKLHSIIKQNKLPSETIYFIDEHSSDRTNSIRFDNISKFVKEVGIDLNVHGDGEVKVFRSLVICISLRYLSFFPKKFNILSSQTGKKLNLSIGLISEHLFYDLSGYVNFVHCHGKGQNRHCFALCNSSIIEQVRQGGIANAIC